MRFISRFILSLLMLTPIMASGQGSQFQSFAFTTGTVNGIPVLKPVTVGYVQICIVQSNGGCTTASIYSDSALTVALPNPLPVDNKGNFGFWALPGSYKYSICQTPVSCSTFSTYISNIGPRGLPGTNGCVVGQTCEGVILSSPGSDQEVTQPDGTRLTINNLYTTQDPTDPLQVAPKGYVDKIGTWTINAAQYCSTPGELDSSCIANAISHAAGATVFVPSGTYDGPNLKLYLDTIHLQLDPNAIINFELSINAPGDGYLGTNTIVLPNNPAAGSASFVGNFSSYSPGDTVLFQQVVNNGLQSMELLTVATASSTTLTTTAGLKFSYTTPSVSNVTTSSIKVAGSVPAGTVSLALNCSSKFSVGEVVRLENISGVDSPFGANNYFEFARIKSCTSSVMTFESSINNTFGDPWIVGLSMMDGVSISGGSFTQFLTVSGVQNATISDINVDTLQVINGYNYQLSRLRGNTQYPASFYFTNLFKGTISDIVATGSTGTTDNGNVQLVGIQNSTISNISTWGGTDTVEGSYPFNVDFNYAPYAMWNNGDTFSSITTGSSIAAGNDYVLRLTGLENSTASNIYATGTIELSDSKNFALNAFNSTKQLLVRNGTGYDFGNFVVGSVLLGQLSAVSNSALHNFVVTGNSTEVGGGAITLFGGSSNIRIMHGEFPLSNNTFFTINASSANPNMYLEDLQDYPGQPNFVASVYTNGSATTMMLVNNRFSGAIQGTLLPSATGPAITPSLTLTGTAPTVGASQLSIGATISAASNCGTIPLAVGCLTINVGGTPRYVPVF